MFKTQYNYKLEVLELGEHTEKVKDKVSITNPDMSYTVRELLQKFTSGQPVQIASNGDYEEDPSFDYINPLTGDYDLSDLVELQFELDTLNASIQVAQAALEAEKAAQAAATNEE